MRIVHVTDCYLPRLGGIETHVADLVRHQAAAGHDVHVVTRTADGIDGSDAAVRGARDGGDAHVHRVRAGWVREMALGSIRTARIVRDLRPDVVHCHNSVLSPLAVAVATATSEAGLPTAVTVHSLLPAVGPLLPLSGTVLAVRETRIAWSAVSEVAAAPVRRVLGPRAAVTVLPNAVDVGWWRDTPPVVVDPLGRSRAAAEVRVVSVGRLAARKRPLALVRMMAGVRSRIPATVPMRLVLVGDGPQRAHIQRRVRDLGMSEWVDLPGRLPRCDVRVVLAAADIYVAPATLESFGIAALEARCVGLPIVAKARGGVGEFMRDGTDGLLARTDHDMVRALARLVESPGLRTTIRANNRALAPTFGWDDALGRTDQLYARAADLVGAAGIGVPPLPDVAAADVEAAR